MLEVCISVFLGLEISNKIHTEDINEDATLSKEEEAEVLIEYYNYKSSLILTILFGVLAVLYSLFFFGLILCPKNKVCKLKPVERMKKFEENVGILYEELEWKNGFVYHLQPVIFLVKRIIFATMCFYLKYELVPIYLMMQLIHLCYYMHVDPYTERGLFRTELFSEVICMLIGLSLQGYRIFKIDCDY
jgi:hypothetical protein